MKKYILIYTPIYERTIIEIFKGELKDLEKRVNELECLVGVHDVEFAGLIQESYTFEAVEKVIQYKAVIDKNIQ